MTAAAATKRQRSPAGAAAAAATADSASSELERVGLEYLRKTIMRRVRKMMLGGATGALQKAKKQQ